VIIVRKLGMSWKLGNCYCNNTTCMDNNIKERILHTCNNVSPLLADQTVQQFLYEICGKAEMNRYGTTVR
jgi:hypothetical protein